MARRAARKRGQFCLAVALTALLLGFTLVTDPVRAAQSAYSKTEHGGRDNNADGTTGAKRDPNQPSAGYTIDATKFPAGDCIHCHDQHASYNGVEHPANALLAFLTPTNSMCASCHDKPHGASFNLGGFAGWAGTQRTLVYTQSKHGSRTSGLQWVAGQSYAGVLNVLNGNLTAVAPPPGRDKVCEKGDCLNCHSAHGYYPGVAAAALASPAEQTDGLLKSMLTRTMGSQTGASPAESNAMCNYCHDNNQMFGSGGDHDLASKSYWYKGSTGPSTTYTGYKATVHNTSALASNLYPGGSSYAARTGEKGLCLNCHDPHGGAPGGNINGAPGSAAAGNKMLVAPMIDPSTPATRNALCFQCHNTIAGTGAQKFVGQAQFQGSKHGSSTNAYWGRTTDVYNTSATSYNAATAAWGPRSAGDYGLCVNCHNPHTKTVSAVSVNGSTTVPKLLLETYNTGNSTGSGSYSANNNKLCYNCHNEARLTSGSTSRFPRHSLHVNNARAFCNDCHNPHGYNPAQVMGSPPAGARGISFNTSTVTASGQNVTINGTATRGPVWFYGATVSGNANRAGCALSCHGEDHNPQEYTPGAAPAPVKLITPEQPLAGAKVLRALLVVEPGASLPAQVQVAFDAPAKRSKSTPVQVNPVNAAPSRSASGGQECTVDIPLPTWTERSSHAVYIRANEGRDAPWSGTMVGVAPQGGPVVTVGYYLGDAAGQPAPTPGGTPAVPEHSTVYLRVRGPGVASGRVSIDAPGDLNDVADAPLTALTPDDAVIEWTVGKAVDTAGRASVTLKGADGRVTAPAAGAYVFVGDGPRRQSYVDLLSSPEIVNADARSNASVMARVTDANGRPLPGRAVEFRRTAGGGSLMARAPVTDDRGQAEAAYLAGVTAETATFEAVDRATGARGWGYVRLRLQSSIAITLLDSGAQNMALPASERLSLTLQAFPRRLPCDGVSTANLVVMVTDGRGLPKPGVMVSFDTAGDNGRVLASHPVTDITGRADAVYVAGRRPGDATIVAKDAMTGASATTTITLNSSGAAKVTLDAAPTVLPADGRSMSQVVVRVKDLAGQPVAGADVILSTQSGYGTLATREATTDAVGEVLTVFAAGQMAGIDAVVATVVSPIPGDPEDSSSSVSGLAPGRFAPAGAGGSPSGSRGGAGGGTGGGAGATAAGGGAVVAGGFGWDFSEGSGSFFGLKDIGLPTPLVTVLNNLSVVYSRWDEFLTLNSADTGSKFRRLSADTWSIRFKRPLRLGIGGLTVSYDMDSGETAQYGWLSRYSRSRATVRSSSRYLDVAATVTGNDTDGEDLRSGLTMRGRASDTYLGATLRPPHWPTVTLSHYSTHLDSTSGAMGYNAGIKRTNLSLYRQFGPIGLQWTSSQTTQNQGYGTGVLRSSFRYSNAGLVLTRDILKGLSVDLSLNRTGTSTEGVAATRDTTQTNSSFQFRFTPLANMTLSGATNGSDVSDSTNTAGAYSSSDQSLEFAYQPLASLGLSAGLRSDGASVAGQRSNLSGSHYGASMRLSPRVNIGFTKTRTAEPDLGPSVGFQSDNTAVQLVHTRILPLTDMIVGWSKIRGASTTNDSDIGTWSARFLSQVRYDMRFSAGLSNSTVSGASDGIGFDLDSRTRDMGLTWTPNRWTQADFLITELTQLGQGATSTSRLTTFRLSTMLSRRSYVVFEAADNVLDQQLLVPTSLGQSLRGSRFSLRLNCIAGLGTTLFGQYERSRDDASASSISRFRMGVSTGF